MKTNLKLLNLIKQWFLNIIFPEKCLGCGSVGETLCQNCIMNMKRAERETEREIIAVFDYREELIKKAIWNLKYYHHFSLGEKLGKLMYEALIEDISEIISYSLGQKIIIIPVPISKDKIKFRGYNQANKIAKGFFLASKENIFEIKNNIIFRKLNSKPQARINNRVERLRNVKGAFGIREEELSSVNNRTIIIIDDVTTTGGTITEIIKILKKAGAKKVIGFTVAH